MKYLLTVFAAFLASVSPAQLIINELSQGVSGTKEYVELLVVGNPSCGAANTVDLRGWVIDDNNSWHASSTGGTGIAAGHVKFDSIAQWANVKIGSLILIYNDADMGTAVSSLTTDVNDANNDCVYIVPISSAVLLKNTTLPASGASMTTYAVPGTPYNPTGNWNALGMANTGDAFHTVSPTNYAIPHHSIGWGNNTLLVDVYFSGAQTGKVIYMNNAVSNNPYLQANFTEANASIDETPGAPNNAANAAWIASLNNNCQAFIPTFTTRNISLCPGQSVIIGGQLVTAAGQYIDTLPAIIGCDTIRTNIVTVGTFNTKNINVSICQGDTAYIAGQPFTTTTTFNDTITSTGNGCDTIISYSVVVSPYISIQKSITFCQGDTVYINHIPYTTSVTINDTIPSVSTCDTVYTYLLNALPISTKSVSVSICSGDTYFAGGALQSSSGLYADTLTSTTGCDSIVFTQLTVNPADTSFQTITVCIGSLFSGITVTNDTTLTYLLNNAAGCDSLAIQNITALPLPVVTIAGDSSVTAGNVATLNAGGAVTYNWSTNQSGSGIVPVIQQTETFSVTGTGANGCTDTASFTVTATVVDEMMPVVPTAFSPNNDGRNDQFGLVNATGYKMTVFHIYNRWGLLVYADPGNMWNGTYKGTLQPAGTYIYYIEAQSIVTNKIYTLKGEVTLLH